MNSAHEFAHAYVKWGWSVFQLRPQSKKPTLSWEEFQHRQATSAELDCWFYGTSNNLAIVTGHGFGVVLDVDPAKGGYESLQGRELGTTLSASTGSGGHHYVYEHPGFLVANAESLNGLAGVDIRGDGGYIVAPPSIHPNGNRYEWVPGLGPDQIEPQPLPGWLAAVLRDRAGALASVTSREGTLEFGVPKLVELITPTCGWLRHCRDDAAELSEWEWYGALTILGRCVDGERLVHEWSRPYPRYTRRETSKKLEHALADSGPLTCRRIAAETGGKWCDGCAARANGIRSPITLGMMGTIEDGPVTAFTWGEVARREVAEELCAARLVELTWLALSRGEDPRPLAIEWNAKRARPPLAESEVERIVAAVKAAKAGMR